MLSYILLITPLFIWLLSNFFLNNQKISLTKNNYKTFIATLFSGLSIYFTVESDGMKDKTLYFFTLAILLELVYIWFVKNTENENYEAKQTILFLLLLVIVVNSWRLLYQIRKGIYDGASCLIVYLVIIMIDFLNK